ncbi:hypothetical protein BDQ17DRAFT_1422405 [Cyathus striatus]|nr:hypothetical protein BDQ17DRAFT_1422405 [Cyathus striatus]
MAAHRESDAPPPYESVDSSPVIGPRPYYRVHQCTAAAPVLREADSPQVIGSRRPRRIHPRAHIDVHTAPAAVRREAIRPQEGRRTTQNTALDLIFSLLRPANTIPRQMPIPPLPTVLSEPLNYDDEPNQPLQIRPLDLVDDIFKAASVASKIIAGNGYKCCMYGRAACFIYGLMDKDPQKIEILVWSPNVVNIEALEKGITESDNNFFLIPSRDPNATRKSLWYSLKPGHLGERNMTNCRRIYMFSHGDFRDIPEDRIVHAKPYNIPLMPFFSLILMKVDLWHVLHMRDSHGMATTYSGYEVSELLRLAVDRYHFKVRETDYWIRGSVMEESMRSVSEFIKRYPNTGGYWQSFFDVDSN